MTKPDYLKVIDDVAKQYSVLETYEQKLLKSWKNFETLASSLNPQYDVLNPDVPNGLIQAATDFITLLYQNDDAAATAQLDCDQIREKDAAYGGSWHARGGTGAFHAFARKGDRLVSMLSKHGSLVGCRKDKTNSESIDDTIGDLRRYLILMVSWHYSLPARDRVERERDYDYVQPGQMEDGNVEFTPEPEPPPAIRCPQCKHTMDHHDSDGCNDIDQNTGGVCDCTRKA